MSVHVVESSDDLKNRLRDAENRLVVLDFYATWCGPCKIISPEVDILATQNPTVIFLKVDVDSCDDIAEDYGISSMPTFIFIKQSKVLESFSGAKKEKLVELIEKHK